MRRGGTRHPGDKHDAPLETNFSGHRPRLTDAEGSYRFVTIKPGGYPWENHANAWRPKHIHFSLFGRACSGSSPRCTSRVTRCSNTTRSTSRCVTSERGHMVAKFDLGLTVPDWALGYRFDIVLAGREATPLEEPP